MFWFAQKLMGAFVGNVKKTILSAMGLTLLATALPATVHAENLFQYLERRRNERAVDQYDRRRLPPPPMREPMRPREYVRPAPAAPVKRAVVSPPKTFAYKADALVKVDFSKVDFQVTGATRSNTSDDVKTALGFMPEGVLSFLFEGEKTQSAVSDEAVRYFASVVDVKAEKDIAAALVRFYSANPDYLWSDHGVMNERAKALVAFFARSHEDGLRPEEYAVKQPDSGLSGEERMKAYAAFDVALTARALRYAKDAGEGRIVANRLSAFHDLPRQTIDLDKLLVELKQGDDPAKVLAAYEPDSKWYLALKLELAKLGGEDNAQGPLIPADTLVRPGATNPHFPDIVALIVKRASKEYMKKHGRLLAAYKGVTTYDEVLKPAIQDFQKASGKTADGVIGPATIAVLQGQSNSVKRQRIILAMERLRWLPRDFTDRYVFVNQPSYHAQYFESGIEKLSMKTVIGSPTHQTYFFYDKIRLVAFNPSWGVPRSIILNEMMPRILADPGYLTRSGYEVFGASGKKVDPYSVNWGKVASTGYGVNIRQKPGPRNALGELKILLPNKHDIYLHDTPAKAGFQRDMRATSHGCVRLSAPRDMAAAVLGTDVKDIKRYFGKDERNVQLKETVPVYFVYFTAWPNSKTGAIQYFGDVYGRDKAMMTADQITSTSREVKAL